MKGLLCKAISSFYYVNCDSTVYECRARGSFRKDGLTPLVGDIVEITVDQNGKGVLEKIYERKNELIRPALSNLDKLFIVSSYSTPSPNLLMIDRLTALCLYGSIKPIIVFNKCDLGDFKDYKEIYKKSGFTTAVVSAATGEGIDLIKEELKDCTSAFTGNSGVGKSSLLNLLFPTLSLKTGEVSEKLGRGRHTTRHSELFAHSYGGFVADTPGFSSIDSSTGTLDFKERLVYCFPDFIEHLGLCKFKDCSHTGEKGCSVLSAVNEGKIAKSRYDSYCAIFDELKGLKAWQTAKK